jgi:hypothetical protein
MFLTHIAAYFDLKKVLFPHFFPADLCVNKKIYITFVFDFNNKKIYFIQ